VTGGRAPQINDRAGGYRIPEYREERVPEALALVAEVGWVYRRPLGSGREGSRRRVHRVLPETGVSLCFVCTRDHEARVHDERLVMVGPIRTVRPFDPDYGAQWVGVRLRPEWCPDAFGIHPGELLDSVVDASRAGWSDAPRLTGRLARTRDSDAALRLLLEAAGARWAAAVPGRAARLAHRALEPLRGEVGSASVSGAARDLGVTPRHLRRVVDATSGGGMKLFHRIRRLHRAASLATAAGDPRWSAIALESGYYDQAHMIRDFRELAGTTPVTFRAQRVACH